VQDNKRHELFYAMRMSLDIARKVVALRISAFSTNERRDDMIYADQRGQEETKRRVGEAGQQQSSNKPKGALEKQQRKSRTLARRDFGDPKHPEKQEIDGLGGPPLLLPSLFLKTGSDSAAAAAASRFVLLTLQDGPPW
jgi:hypothetical protein